MCFSLVSVSVSVTVFSVFYSVLQSLIGFLSQLIKKIAFTFICLLQLVSEPSVKSTTQ